MRFPPFWKKNQRFTFDLYSQSVCVSTDEADVRELLTSTWGEDVVFNKETLVRRDYAALSHLCFLPFF